MAQAIMHTHKQCNPCACGIPVLLICVHVWSGTFHFRLVDSVFGVQNRSSSSIGWLVIMPKNQAVHMAKICILLRILLLILKHCDRVVEVERSDLYNKFGVKFWLELHLP